MKVIFSHGKESGPWGSKIKAMADLASERGFDIDSIDYQDLRDDPEARVQRLRSIVESTDAPFALVGSSMGGYVSAVVSCQVDCEGLFLLAPALFISGYQVHYYPSKATRVEVIHGWSDTVIPPELSIRFAREANCTLHLIPGDHRLNSSLDEVLDLFERFLERLGSK